MMPGRHPQEILLLVLNSLAAVVVVVAAVVTALGAAVLGGVEIPEEMSAVATVPLLVWFLRGRKFAEQRVNGVPITAGQFPVAHAMVAEASHVFGFEEVPDAYLVPGSGVVKAFTGGHAGRRYIVIHSDLLEVGGRTRNPEALRFLIGHELGHIAAKHNTFWRTIVSLLTARIPLLGPALSRAQEYTADNYGYAFCPEGAPSGMALLAVGKYLPNHVDYHALCDRAASERGFFVWFVNLVSTRPALLWRASALRDRGRPGRLLFRPRAPQPMAWLPLVPHAEPLLRRG